MRRATLLGALALAACSDPVSPPPVPAELVVLKAAPAVTTPGALIDTISVRLLDAQGRPVPGQRVEWTGDGTLESLDSVTDALGLAHARWVLPRYPDPVFLWSVGPSGTHQAVATWANLPAARFETTTRAFTVDRLDAAFDYACGIRGVELWCWGGYPRPVGWAAVPVPRNFELPPGVAPTEVLTAQAVMCILDQAGAPWCLPAGGGTGVTELAGAPPLRDIDGESGFEPQSAHLCGLTRTEGRPWCWSYDQAGTAVGGFIGTGSFAQLAVGEAHACGLSLDQRAWCWGQNDRGQLGDGGSADSGIPVAVSGGLAFERITAKGDATCGAASGGEVYCWGFGPHFVEVREPAIIPDPAIVGPDIVMGSVWEIHSIRNGGRLETWWRGSLVPLFRHVETLQVAEVAGDGQTCLRTRDGQVYCSWILLNGGGDTSALSADVIPVPDPASQVDP